MRVLQVLPELNSGGVERGTVDFARELVARGHQSLVMSNGGRIVPQLEAEGSRHITWPVHKKSLLSLRHVRPLRRALLQWAPDIVHVRSRLPAWLVWLAAKKMPASRRPALVSTFHGLYSVNRYSEIMGCGDAVIAISDCVADYIRGHYPRIDPGKITVIHRGVDSAHFNPRTEVPAPWREDFFQRFPRCRDKPLLTLAGRLSRWKGQLDFIALIEQLLNRGIDCHGLIVGDITPGKDAYREELRRTVIDRGLEQSITFTGHESRMENIYRLSSIVYNLSQRPEPFGRTVIEALAMGVPVIAYNYGGPAESLRDCLPEGLVSRGDITALVQATADFIADKPSFSLPEEFTLPVQTEKTLTVYRQLLEARQARGLST